MYVCMCDRVSYMKMTRGTNLMQQFDIVCSWYHSLRVQPVWPTYACLQALHVNEYMLLMSCASSWYLSSFLRNACLYHCPCSFNPNMQRPSHLSEEMHLCSYTHTEVVTWFWILTSHMIWQSSFVTTDPDW